jgi:(p)ppGpp synthase/HD superfamily hydrolase
MTFERLQKAVQIANEIHTNAPDKLGYSSIFHPMRVMIMGDRDNENDLILRILHDSIEDMPYDYPDPRVSFGLSIRCGLNILTHRRDESYINYIKNIKNHGSEILINIKLDDIWDNLNRLNGLPIEDQIRMKNKYYKAVKILMSD